MFELNQWERIGPPVLLLGNNKGSIDLAKNPEFHSRTKHILVQYHYIRDLIEHNDVEVRYVSTNDMAADFLTKPLPKDKHWNCVQLVGLRPGFNV